LFGEDKDLRGDLFVYEVGAEQTLHFKQLFVAVEKLGWAKKDQFVHVAHGLVRLAEGKMSTRKGNTIKLDELLSRSIEKAAGINPDSAEIVGIGAVKFNDLKRHYSRDYVFDWREILSLEGDSGPYLQYTAVRARSVLSKSVDDRGELGKKVNEEEERVLRWLYRFSEVVEGAAKKYSPNLVCNYLIELSKRFNSFYNKHRILEERRNSFRLMLTASVLQILENGLGLLGIEVPEVM